MMRRGAREERRGRVRGKKREQYVNWRKEREGDEIKKKGEREEATEEAREEGREKGEEKGKGKKEAADKKKC